jgi:hypothetical protein
LGAEIFSASLRLCVKATVGSVGDRLSDYQRRNDIKKNVATATHAEAGIVSTHAHRMFAAIPHRTALIR